MPCKRSGELCTDSAEVRQKEGVGSEWLEDTIGKSFSSRANGSLSMEWRNRCFFAKIFPL